jgi:hypothetical protein
LLESVDFGFPDSLQSGRFSEQTAVKLKGGAGITKRFSQATGFKAGNLQIIGIGTAGAIAAMDDIQKSIQSCFLQAFPFFAGPGFREILEHNSKADLGLIPG